MTKLTFEQLQSMDQFKLSITGQRLDTSEYYSILNWFNNQSKPKTKLINQALNHGQTVWNQEQTLLGNSYLRTPEGASKYLAKTHGAHIKAHSSANHKPFKGVNRAENIIMQDRITNTSYRNSTMSQKAFDSTYSKNKHVAYNAEKGIERPEGYRYAGKDSTVKESMTKMTNESNESVADMKKTIKEINAKTKMREEYTREQVDANRTRLNNQIKDAVNESVSNGLSAGITAGVLTFIDHAIDVLTSYINLEITKQQMIEYMKQIAKTAIFNGLKAAGAAILLTLLDKLLIAILPTGCNQVYLAVKAILASAGIYEACYMIKRLALRLYELVKLYFTSDSPHAFKAHVEKVVVTLQQAMNPDYKALGLI